MPVSNIDDDHVSHAYLASYALPRRSLLTLASATVLASMSSPSGQALELSHDGSVLKMVDDLYNLKRRAYRTGDANLLKDFYATDAVVTGEQFPLIRGIRDLVAVYEKALPKYRDVSVVPLYRVTSTLGDVAYDFAKFRPTAKLPVDDRPASTLLFIWRKDPKGWRCAVEIVLRSELDFSPPAAPIPSK